MTYPARNDTLAYARHYRRTHNALESAGPLSPGAYAGSLVDDAQAGLIRRALVDASETTLAALDRLANGNGVVPAQVMRMAVRYERARRRAFPARELARAS